MYYSLYNIPGTNLTPFTDHPTPVPMLGVDPIMANCVRMHTHSTSLREIQTLGYAELWHSKGGGPLTTKRMIEKVVSMGPFNASKCNSHTTAHDLCEFCAANSFTIERVTDSKLTSIFQRSQRSKPRRGSWSVTLLKLIAEECADAEDMGDDGGERNELSSDHVTPLSDSSSLPAQVVAKEMKDDLHDGYYRYHLMQMEEGSEQSFYFVDNCESEDHRLGHIAARLSEWVLSPTSSSTMIYNDLKYPIQVSE